MVAPDCLCSNEIIVLIFLGPYCSPKLLFKLPLLLQTTSHTIVTLRFYNPTLTPFSHAPPLTILLYHLQPCRTSLCYILRYHLHSTRSTPTHVCLHRRIEMCVESMGRRARMWWTKVSGCGRRRQCVVDFKHQAGWRGAR